MVVKIQPPSSSVSRVLDYNDRKVDAGQCEVVGLWNTGTIYVSRSYDVLEAFERGSRKSRNTVFHASVNPSVTDNMDRDKALRFIRDMMEQLGYGRQPMVIYEHNDTGRLHWHIVSVRVDAQGYKINDLYENKRCNEIVRSLQSRYGFTLGRPDGADRNEQGQDVSITLSTLIEKALKYRCTTMTQLRLVLECLGVRTIETPSAVSYQLLDNKGKPRCAAIDAMDLMIPSREEMEKTVQKNRWSNEDTFRRRSRVNGCVKAALSGARSEEEFRRKLSSKGIDAVFSRTDEGRIFGVTFIDHTSRSVFKGSELEKGLSAAAFQELSTGAWSASSSQDAPASVARKQSEEQSVTRMIVQGAIEAAASSGDFGEHDIPKKRRRKRRI